MDTGIGTSAYSVIEQGRVGFIVDANTKDRRAILEEAAASRATRRGANWRCASSSGSSSTCSASARCSARSAAGQDGDQAGAAALRYRELSDKLRDLRLAFALEEFGRLTGDLRELGGRGELLSTQGAELAAKLGGLEAGLAEADTRLIALEAQARELETQRGDAQSRRDVAESKARDAKYGWSRSTSRKPTTARRW